MVDTLTRFPSLSHWGAYTALVRNGRVVGCEPFAHDRAPSPLIHSMPDLVHSPLRIARPSVRASWLKHRGAPELRGVEGYVEVGWDTALRLVHDELQRVRAAHGPAAIFGGSYGWSSAGRLHHARTLTHRFLYAGGGCVDQSGNYSWGAAQFLLPHIIGTYAPVTGRVTDWHSVVGNTRLFIAFGGIALRNTQITSGGAGDHGTPGWLERARLAGIRSVVVSPARSDAPQALQAEWVPIRPNTDAAMMLGMAHTLLSEGLHDQAFLERCCSGFERYADYVSGRADGQAKSAEWAEGICGVPAATIRRLAREAAGCRTLITCAWSLQRGHRGEQPYWGSVALAALLGQIGLPGGGFAFAHGSMNGAGNPRPDLPAPEMRAGANPAGASVPVARLTDMLLHPGQAYEFNGKGGVYPDIRLVYWAGGNPFHHQQDLNRLERAWRKPETIIVHEPWWTPTARRADIVLPATTTLERNDVGGSSRDRYILAMHQALPPVGQSRNDFDIYRELAAMAGFEHAYTEGRGEMAWIRHIYEQMRPAWEAAQLELPGFDEFWARGHVALPEPDRDFVLFEQFRQDPVAHPLKTRSGRLELYSEAVAAFGYEDCPPHPAWLAPAEWLGAEQADRWPLHLVTCQPEGRLHSQLDQARASRQGKIAGREPVRMHPADAAERGIGQGDVVRLYNDRGACLGGADLDEGLARGVVAMFTGAWFDPQDATLERHGNPNVLTMDVGTSRLAQGSSALSALVQVEKWQGGPAPVQAFEPPALTRLPA
ncbi:molybdopterin-dependent oxidoreductase [Achromobacter deleyi]|uniref:molybdopterin-dependent oxidoreductase n=1 Tax=Achromobacter deleyi TaxID=1353891 RepID=UPI001491C836|nr:molybdopterin-dependent oxidoreductase [Achromobacter deleyi]QVQ24189.1 molybdopterin-dependent oxidoreductase [Achromobacter deleyi]UIP19720.1 molybdopterin-dependent oxidoreductase [Achromobacter deleyi]